MGILWHYPSSTANDQLDQHVLRCILANVCGDRVCMCVGVCVCVCAGKNNIKEGDAHGSGTPVVVWGAIKISAACGMCAPYAAPVGVAARGLAWVGTSGAVGSCDIHPGACVPSRVLLRHSRPLRGGGGESGPPSSFAGLASGRQLLLAALGPLI